MNQLQIYDSMSVIMFHDKTVKFLPTVKAEMLFELSSKQEQFILDGGMYKFSAVAKIIPEHEYYQQYPEKRPTVYSADYQTAEEYVEVMTPIKRINALMGIIKGLDQFITKQQAIKGPISNAIKSRALWIEKIELAKLEQ